MKYVTRQFEPRRPPGTRGAEQPGQALITSGTPFELGGIEKVTWDVYKALQLRLEGQVALLPLVGRSERQPGPHDDTRIYEAGPNLNLLSKLKFSGRILRFARMRPASTLMCMHINHCWVVAAARLAFGNRYAAWVYGSEVWSGLSSLSKGALKLADVVFAVSNYTRQRLLEQSNLDPRKVVTLYPAVSDACLNRAKEVSQSAGQAPPTILSIGRLVRGSEYKGFDTVIRALPRLAEQVPEVRYKIIGSGDGLEYLRKLATSLGVYERLHFMGSISNAELWDILENVRVFAMPSRQGRDLETGEGFGIVYLEAAALARPVVGSCCGGAAEAVVDGVTGKAPNPESLEQVTDALLGYLLDGKLADTAGKAGQERVLSSFTFKQFCTHLWEELERFELVRCRSSLSSSGRDIGE